MPKFKTKPELMECLLERLAKGNGFLLIHDGSKNRDWNTPEAPTFFTRVYRATLDGNLINTWMRFTYDLRTGYADFHISNRDLAEYNRVMEAKENGSKGLATEKINRDAIRTRVPRQARESH